MASAISVNHICVVYIFSLANSKRFALDSAVFPVPALFAQNNAFRSLLSIERHRFDRLVR